MRSRILRLLIVPVLAGALLVSGTNAAQAASVTQATSRAAVEAKAVQAGEAVAESLRTTGTAVFTGADGTVHRMSLTGAGLAIDGQAPPLAGPFGAQAPAPASIWCNIKVAAAIAIIATLSAAFIGLVISGLPAATTVAIAGLRLTVAQWSRVAILIGSGGALVSFLHTILC